MSRRDPPEVRQARGSAQPAPGRCGAKLALTDPPRYCLQRSKPRGNGRCGRFGHHAAPRADGGSFGFATDNPAYKDGRRSGYAWLTPGMAARLQEAMADPRVFDLGEDVALLEVLKQEAARDYEAGASAALVARLRAQFEALRQALPAKQRPAARKALARIGALFATSGPVLARQQLEETLERKARMVKTRQEVLTESEGLVPVKRVAAAMAGVALIVREFLTDDQQRLEFTRRFVGYVGPRLRPVDIPAGGGDGGPAAGATAGEPVVG